MTMNFNETGFYFMKLLIEINYLPYRNAKH